MPLDASPPDREERDRSQKRAGGGVVATWTKLLVLSLVGVAQAPILFKHVPAAELGVWYLLFTIATFVSLSDLGLPSTFARAVSFLWGRQLAGPDTPPAAAIPDIYHRVTLAQLYASAFIGALVLSFAFTLVVIPGALLYFGAGLSGGPPTMSLVVPLATFLVGVVCNQAAAIPAACLSGFGDVPLESAVRTATALIGFTLVCLLVPARGNLVVLTVIFMAQGVVALVASHVVLSRRHPIGRLRDMRADLALIRSMLKESASFFVSRVGVWLTGESTLLIAGHFLGSHRIADFALLRQIVAAGGGLTIAIPTAVSPHVAAAFSAGNRAKVHSLSLATMRYSLIVNVLWSVGALLWAPDVLSLLVGPGHVLGYGVLVPVMVGSLLELHGATHAFLMFAFGRWPLAPYIAAAGALNIAFGWVGCATWGFAGLAWGAMAAQAVTLYWVQPMYSLRYVGVTVRSYLKNTLGPGLAYALVLVSTGYGVLTLRSVFGAGSGGARFDRLAFTSTGIAVTSLCGAILAWVIVLTKDDRSYFLRLLRFGS